jgi:ATP-dependent DNA helicase RecQ
MNLELAHQALKKYYGYDAFRPMQEDIIRNVLDKKDCLVLMPTGGGKSICYQIPAVILPGVTIVVSPLISLMKDQVEALLGNGISAAYINSSQSFDEMHRIENLLLDNKLQLLYVSPEKIVSSSFLPFLKSLPINLFAVDEAHCISSWGHDFRPEYTQMGFLKDQFPEVPIIALTATADKLTRKDIVSQLKLEDAEVFISSFDRPNLSLEVRSGQKRIEQILEFIKSRPKQVGIIYCLSRKSTEEVAAKLNAQGIKAAAYHAQVEPFERAKVQEDFINDKVQVVCATVAFGMGIDKSNVRWVIHYNLPKNIESYYQEIGRAGRDGLLSETVLFFSYQDVNIYRDMFREADSKTQELQNAKLDRMLQFADAQICRRRILLNYFSEVYDKDCGNCDICKSPPKYFDGTKYTQMAISAVTRVEEQITMGMLVDVLRGSAKHELLQKGYEKIKTYGVGREISVFDWQSYIWQMIQNGIFEIAYDDYHKLRLLAVSKEVLLGNKQLQLFKPLSIKERDELNKKITVAKTKSDTPRIRVRNELFDYLREYRRDLANERGIAPYIIFSDATLAEIAAVVPLTEVAFRSISGVGELKWQQLGEIFIKKIKTYIKDNPDFLKKGAIETPMNAAPKPINESKVPTAQQSYEMYRKGATIDEISEQRFLSPSTISGHILKYYEQGDPVDIYQFISDNELFEISAALDKLPENSKTAEIYQYLDEKFNYDKIRWAQAYRAREVG